MSNRVPTWLIRLITRSEPSVFDMRVINPISRDGTAACTAASVRSGLSSMNAPICCRTSGVRYVWNVSSRLTAMEQRYSVRSRSTSIPLALVAPGPGRRCARYAPQALGQAEQHSEQQQQAEAGFEVGEEMLALAADEEGDQHRMRRQRRDARR